MRTCASKAGEPVPFRFLFLLFCISHTLVISAEPGPLSFRPSGASGEICPGFRQTTRCSAKQPHGKPLSARCAGGCGAPQAEIGPWRTLSGLVWPSSGCSCAATWRSGEAGKQRGWWWEEEREEGEGAENRGGEWGVEESRRNLLYL